MRPFLTLLTGSPYIDLFKSPLDWAGWLILLGGTLALVFRLRGMQKQGGRIWLAAFLVLAFISNLFLGIRLSSGGALPPAGLPSGPHNPLWIIFSCLPWMLAAGFLGSVDAFFVGLLAGLTRGLWDTHNLFTLLQPALLAVLFAAAIRQRYRTLFFRLLRQPLFTSAALVPLYGLYFLYSSLFSSSGSLPARIDFALTNLQPAMLAGAAELILMGVFVQVIALTLPRSWAGKGALVPSPAELSLQTRILTSGGLLIALLMVSVITGDWIVAGNAARRLLRDRLVGMAETTAAALPTFLNTGQTYLQQISLQPQMVNESGQSLSSFLGESIKTVPYFDQLTVLDLKGKVLAAYPPSPDTPFGLAQAETSGLALAAQGVPVQSYSLPPVDGANAARLSFLTAIFGEDGKTQRVLLGRTDLSKNPLFKPVLVNLQGLSLPGGKGKLLDEEGRILYSPNPAELMSQYTGATGEQPLFYDITAPDGTRDLAYYQPVQGSSWSVVLLLPAEKAQELALNIAAPLLILVLVLGVAAALALRLSLRVVAGSLQSLTVEAGRIARGQLDQPLEGGGVDEVGQLRLAFEQMRVSMQSRLEELNQLLLVSQGVASTLDMEGAVQPILEAVLASGASAVRIALVPSMQPQEGLPLSYALGPARDLYAPLDEIILKLAGKQGRLVYDNLNRLRSLEMPEGQPHPEALVAVSLSHEKRFYGVLWAAFDQPHPFTEEDLRFLATLASQAALAASNTRLFRTAEVGRQRLAAILASSPDPVLVTDAENRLILANPAAKRALGSTAGGAEGQPTERVIGQQELRELLREFESEKGSAEVAMPDGKIYYATASAVIADGRPVGRVCVMQDVTHFKELDSLKSDFVSSVSHDLRSPLTLIRGYTTMLGMVGDLNEQQQGYVSKITVGVESMARLVSNLLDLGRLTSAVGLQLEKVAPLDVVETVCKTLKLLADQKNITLEVQADAHVPPAIDADRALIQQALFNLAENGIKYTPKGGKVTLRVKPLPGSILFEVQDTGIGIPPADQPRLFEKFFRGSSREARAERGTGLGLAIVRSIAERHGGKVWVESSLGQGSIFFLLVPKSHPQPPEKDPLKN